MKNWTLVLLSLLLVVLLAIPVGVVAAPTVSLSPSSVGVTIGEEFDVSILVDVEATDLSCYAITFDFDETLLEVVSVIEGDLFGTAGEATFFSEGVDSQGLPVWTNCLLGFGTSVAGPGELVKVRFRAILNGSSALDLANVDLRDVDRAIIPGVVMQDGSASVGVTATPPVFANAAPRLIASPNPSSGPVALELRSDVASHGKLDLSALWSQGSVTVFDVAGRRVRTLMGSAAHTWDGRGEDGIRVASGTYLAVFEHPAVGQVVRKLVRFE